MPSDSICPERNTERQEFKAGKAKIRVLPPETLRFTASARSSLPADFRTGPGISFRPRTPLEFFRFN